MVALLRVRGLTLAHESAEAVRDVSFDVARGEVVALVGPSGAGKSTLLAALAGLAKPRAGTIITQHGALTQPTLRHAIVFQESALFPWLTLRQNVIYALTRRRIPRSERNARTDELLRRVRLGAHGHKFPHELSGGMKKRGAFARALATEPEVLLLDEPFSALDVATRAELQGELLELFSARGVGVVIVTHDVDEAVTLSDRVLVMDGPPGEIIGEIQIAAARPRDLADATVKAAHAEISKTIARARATQAQEEERHEHLAARGTGARRVLAVGGRIASAR